MTTNTQSPVKIWSPESYTSHYQPTFPDAAAVLAARQELGSMPGISNAERINECLRDLGQIALGQTNRKVFIIGSSAEKIDISQPISNITRRIDAVVAIARSVFPDSKLVTRTASQNGKPRSSATEIVDAPEDFSVDSYFSNQAKNLYRPLMTTQAVSAKKIEIPSYIGDAANSAEATLKARTPDPSNLVGAAIQAENIREDLDQSGLDDVDTAHEAIFMDYEEPLKNRVGEQTILRSSDIVWIGNRTRWYKKDTSGQITYSPQIELLEDAANPVGIKIGPGTTAEDVKVLTQKLNPTGVPGKIIWTLRYTLEALAEVDAIFEAIDEYSDGSCIMIDPMHGVTKSANNGYKTRSVEDIQKVVAYSILSARKAAKKSNKPTIKIHGLHLEASGESNKHECVIRSHELPLHKALVDPELNNHHLQQVLEGYKKYEEMNSEQLALCC